MGKIFCIIGKSATGKDTVYKKVLEQINGLNSYVLNDVNEIGTTVSGIQGRKAEGGIGTICSYTTRPIRSGEQEGVEYHFVSVDEFKKMEAAGKVIESRVYHTVYGDWYYFTADDGQIALDKRDYLLIMTLEGYISLEKYFGKMSVVPIYIEVEDGLRLSRAVERERSQKNPKYTELCRRFLADAEDFSEDKLAEIDNLIRLENNELNTCVEQVIKTLQNA